MAPNLDDGRFRDHAANERTMLAWLRTGIALMAFGFAIARFGLFVREVEATAPTIRYEVNRRALAADRPVAPSPVLVYVVGIASVILGATMAAVLGAASP
jgi:putative membrane protein